MRILHLVGRSHRRGAEQVAMELSAELDALGHSDEIWAIGPGHSGESVPEIPVLTDSSLHRPVTLARAGRELRRRTAHRRPDLIVAHGAAAAVAATVAAPWRPPKIVWQTILGLAPRSFGGADVVMWRVVARRVDAVVALTPEMGEEVRRLGHRGPVWSLPNARSTARFEGLERSSSGAGLRRELGIGPDGPVIGFVGYLVDQKRPRVALDVFASVLRDHPSAHLVVVGEGPLRTEVEAHARLLGVTDKVHLLGHRDDVATLLASFDVCLVTSDDEGVPGVAIEAAMAGCPLATFRLGSVADVVVDSVTGLVVPADRPTEMASRVAALLEDQDLLASMSAAALERSAMFSMAAVARRYEAHFMELGPPDDHFGHAR